MSPVLNLNPGTIFAGDFRIVSPLNAGGMGAVYVADQLSTGFQRALKIMLPELLADPELRDRFLREARVCAHIQSDHIVQVVAAGIDQPTSMPWLAMELLHGEDLSEYIARRARIAPTGLVEIYRQLCHGLGAAHAVGIVHRDLKPENIFLAVSKRAGSPFTVKVLDFGIAKMISDASAKMTALIGSPLWMAPEQMDPRAQISPATDVWPIALLAFWLLTGEHYWRSARTKPTSMHGIMREVLFEPLPSATERATELGLGEFIPAGFDEWFSRCLARDPAGRVQTAWDALEELERELNIGPRGTMPHVPAMDMDGEPLAQDLDVETSGGEIEPPVSEMMPPTLQSSTSASGRRESSPAPPRRDSSPVATPAPSPSKPPSKPPPAPAPAATASAPAAASPASAAVPVSMSAAGAPGSESSRRSSAASMAAMKSTAPLWMLVGGLVILLGVILFVVRQRTSAVAQGTGVDAPPSTSISASALQLTAPAPAPPPPPALPSASASASASAGDVKPPAPSAEPATTEGSKNFDKATATQLLKTAVTAARACKRQFGPTGPGQVKVTFIPNGSVGSALLITQQFSGTMVGTCVANEFLKLHISPFEGSPVTTTVQFEIP